MVFSDFNVRPLIKLVSNFSYAGPSMLSGEEKAFYYFLGSKCLTLDGVVVDAGCWLGSSSYYLGKGIEANLRYNGSQTIYACDIYRWDKTHDLQIKNHPIALNENDDFQFLTKKFLESVNLNVQTKKIDYSISPQSVSYHGGEPIEALMIDAGKTPDLLFNILRGYLPHCIENKTIIFFQDYRDYWCWFIPPIVQFMEETMEPVIFLQSGGAGFRFRNKSKALQLIDEAEKMFEEGTSISKYYEQVIIRIGSSNLSASYQVKANKVGLFLHLLKATEVYFGHENPVNKIDSQNENELMKYLRELDHAWPAAVLDGSLQNAYRRIRHAVTGKKDLSLVFKSPYYYKRRILNPLYTKVKIKRLLG